MNRPLSPDLLAAAGRALYGERWQSALAADLGISDRNMRYWLTGDRAPRDVEEVRARLLRLLSDRNVAIAAVVKSLR